MALTPHDLQCLENAKKFIDGDVSKHHSITEIARHVGLSETKLKNGFRNIFGTGLFEYLEKERLAKGKYFLENTDKPLKEISKILGYRYNNNFITAFKKKFGNTPASWKRGLQYLPGCILFLPDCRVFLLYLAFIIIRHY